jgi:SAM-dependent methyltransferase
MGREVDAAVLQQVAAQTVARYRQRFAEHGYGARALGWGSAEQQRYRFAQTLAGPIDLTGCTVLDIGCGFGDYRDFLLAAKPGAGVYHGWDVNPDLVAEAGRRHADDAGVRFSVRDFMDPGVESVSPAPVADVGVMLGVLNFHLGGQVDNYAYSELALRRAWALVGRALIVDFLSTHREAGYAAEGWVFHHDPGRMVDFALTLSPRVTLKHDYRPIPQREFMLFIEHE